MGKAAALKAKAGGAKEGAKEGAKGKAGAAKGGEGKKKGRVLSTGITISSEVTDDGYEADSDSNTQGFEASEFEFADEVDSSVTDPAAGAAGTGTAKATNATTAAGNGINKAASLMTFVLVLAGIALMN